MSYNVTYERLIADLNRFDKKYNEIYETTYSCKNTNPFTFSCFKSPLKDGDLIVTHWYNNGPLAQGSHEYLVRNGMLIEIAEGDLKS
jgi:hypothetical protein